MKHTESGCSRVLAMWDGIVKTTLLLSRETNPSGVSYVKLYPPLSNLMTLASFQDNFTLLPNLPKSTWLIST
jgi:hypothetical protein